MIRPLPPSFLTFLCFDRKRYYYYARWMVDLFFPRKISSVVIMNRPEPELQNRLDGIVVELLDPNGKTVAFVQHDLAKDGEFGAMWTATFENQSARKVRISVERPDECEYLNLAEVQVYSDQCTEKDSCDEGSGCDYGNVAMCKNAEQVR